MKWSIALKKGIWTFVLVVIGYLIANPSILQGIIPASIWNMTIGGALLAGLKILENWLKHRGN